jgi:hypothetical protein
MNNIVNWVHMLEDSETATFLHGQELIFTTGIGYENTDWLLDFTKGLVAAQASGLVLNIGPHIKSVPEELVAYCREANFPLFTIPWKTRIVDITNDFCRKIIKSEESEVSTAGAFKDAIFSPDKVSDYRPALERKEFNPDADYSIVAMSLKMPKNESFAEFDKTIRNQLSRILFEHSDRFSIFRQDKYLIVVLQSFPKIFVEASLDRLNDICRYHGSEYGMNAGISVNDKGLGSLSRNYKRAVSLLNIARRRNLTRVSYDDIGIYQLLLEIEDADVLRRFYEGSLGELEAYDRKNQTDLLVTLKSYLDSNASVQEVAKETFMHRNTINYKIKKIKELLGCELDYQDGIRLMLAFNIKDLL